jgi:hypothetical protein
VEVAGAVGLAVTARRRRVIINILGIIIIKIQTHSTAARS